MSEGLTSGAEFLQRATAEFIRDWKQSPKLRFDDQLKKGLEWRPSIIFSPDKVSKIAIELSDDKPYPLIFRMRRAELESLEEPVSIYCVCPESVFADGQKEANELRDHGFGLITIDENGRGRCVHSCIPFMNRILESDFKQEVKGLPLTFRRRCHQAYDTYRVDPVRGLSSLGEMVEGMINRAAREAIKKQICVVGEVGPNKTAANKLDGFLQSDKMIAARAALGSVRGFMRDARNVANHPQNTQKKYAERLRKSRVYFLSGIRIIDTFRTDLKKVNLTGGFD